jgi:hypothetical protein
VLKIIPAVTPVYGVFRLYRYEGKGQNDKNGLFARVSLSFVFLRWIKRYAFLTLWDGRWLTR